MNDMQDMLASLPQLKEVKEKVSLIFTISIRSLTTSIVVVASHDGGEVYGVIRKEEVTAFCFSRTGESIV